MTDIQKALSLQSQGMLDEAQKIYEDFLKKNPIQPDVSNLLGLVYLQKNDYDKACELFQTAVNGFPCAEFYQNLGLAYFKKKEYQTAMQNFSKAVEYESQNADFIRNFARMAKTTKQTDFAIDFFKKVVHLEPENEKDWNNLGLLYEEKHDFENAKDCYIKSLKIKDNYEANHNLGVLYRTLRNFDESIKCLSHALSLSPGNQETMISLGMSYLSKKDIKNGYKYYKYLNKVMQDKFKNRWDGKKHPESTLFVFYYAGYGDNIMLCRYLVFLKDCFKSVKVWLQPSVRILIEKNIKGDWIEFVDTCNTEYDYSACIMDIHYLLGMDFEHIPFSEGYLNVPKEKTEKYKKEYFKTTKRKIGLFWQGNPNVFANRSIKLKELEPVMSFSGTKLFSFEKDDKENQIKDYPEIVNLGPTFKNFEDTAAALKCLDIFITIDSAIAHLAGALGVKTFLLLPYSSEWRWFEDKKQTAWYDSIKIFKQNIPYDWSTPVREISEELKNTFGT